MLLPVLLVPFLSWKDLGKRQEYSSSANEKVITMCGSFSVSDEYMSSPVKLLSGLAYAGVEGNDADNVITYER